LNGGTDKEPQKGGSVKLRDVFAADRSHLARILYFHEQDPYHPKAWIEYQKFIQGIAQYFASYPTIVADSASFMELAARKYDQYVLNPDVKDPRKWYAAAASAMEEAIWAHPVGWPVNVVLSCHVEQDKDEVHGMFVRTPMVRGKQLIGKIGAAYQEMYRAFVRRDPQGMLEHKLQTRINEMYTARSMIRAPDPCEMTYEKLWGGMVPWTVLHCLVYGEPGSGKTTFAATWPKPLLVLFWDPIGKDLPYLELGLRTGGSVSELQTV
jgi:hypothetical protein